MDYDAAIARAEELAGRPRSAADLLFFARAALRYQRDIHHRAKSRSKSDPQRLDTAMLAGYLPDFLQLVEKYGPPELVRQAQRFEDRQDWEAILRACWQQSRDGQEIIARGVLQPYVQHLAERWSAEVGGLAEGTGACPFCSRAPVAALETGKRLLVCSLCAHEWGFPAGTCPGCRAEDLETFRHRSMSHVRAEACRACRRYLKVVDLRREPKAVGIVDELAAVEVDRLARAKGCSKLETNLAGQ